MVGLFAVVLTGIGSAAYAAVPGPDRIGDGNPALPAPPVSLAAAHVSTSAGGTSFAQQVGWMLSGAAIVLLVAAVLVGIAVLSRRHRVGTRQLQMP